MEDGVGRMLTFEGVWQIGHEAVFEIDLILISKWSGPLTRLMTFKQAGSKNSV
jgi:hypothetical protein